MSANNDVVPGRLRQAATVSAVGGSLDVGPTNGHGLQLVSSTWGRARLDFEIESDDFGPPPEELGVFVGETRVDADLDLTQAGNWLLTTEFSPDDVGRGRKVVQFAASDRRFSAEPLEVGVIFILDPRDRPRSSPRRNPSTFSEFASTSGSEMTVNRKEAAAGLGTAGVIGLGIGRLI